MSGHRMLRPEVCDIEGFKQIRFFEPDSSSFYLALGTSFIETFNRFKLLPEILDPLYSKFQENIEKGKKYANHWQSEYSLFCQLLSVLFEAPIEECQSWLLQYLEKDLENACCALDIGIRCFVCAVLEPQAVEIQKILEGTVSEMESLSYLDCIGEKMSVNVLIVDLEKVSMRWNSSRSEQVILPLFYGGNGKFGVVYHEDFLELVATGELAKGLNEFPFIEKKPEEEKRIEKNEVRDLIEVNINKEYKEEKSLFEKYENVKVLLNTLAHRLISPEEVPIPEIFEVISSAIEECPEINEGFIKNLQETIQPPL